MIQLSTRTELFASVLTVETRRTSVQPDGKTTPVVYRHAKVGDHEAMLKANKNAYEGKS